MRNSLQSFAQLGLLGCSLLFTACATPKVVDVYDEKCQVMTRKVELTLEKVEALDSCRNQECVAQVIGGALSLATSTIVSGSIALVGNVAFWLEKSANCKAVSTTSKPSGSIPASAPASATTPR
jgi:hypothetical protein